MYKSKSTLNIFFIVIVFVTIPAYPSNFIKHGFIDFNIYPYQSKVNNDNSLTVNAFAQFPNRFSYFSLTNFYDEQGNDWVPELNAFYTEQNLRWQIADDSAFQLTIQANFRQGNNNDRHRLGILWRLNKTPVLDELLKAINLSYFINFHVIQFDHEDPYVWQMEHVFLLKFPYLSERLYLSGFMDHTFNQDLPEHFPINPIIGEVQLGYRLVDNFYVISEYRVNQYRRSNVNNMAMGFEYKFGW